MQRSYKRLVLSIIVVLLAGVFAFAQEKQGYKEVVLDGKPAKLNLATGEITFVNPNDKKEPIKFDDYVAAEKKNTEKLLDSNKIVGLHVVQEGETLLDIANYYKVSLRKLKEENNLETTLVDVGQVLKVKNFDAEDADEVSEVKQINRPNYDAFKALNTSGFHVVKKGETLYQIAQKYDLDIDNLKQFNGLGSNIIQIGQRLRLTNTDVPIESQNENNDPSIWLVSKGDTLYSIARKNGLSVYQLKQLNDLSTDTIYIGQKLRIQ